MRAVLVVVCCGGVLAALARTTHALPDYPVLQPLPALPWEEDSKPPALHHPPAIETNHNHHNHNHHNHAATVEKEEEEEEGARVRERAVEEGEGGAGQGNLLRFVPLSYLTPEDDDNNDNHKDKEDAAKESGTSGSVDNLVEADVERGWHMLPLMDLEGPPHGDKRGGGNNDASGNSQQQEAATLPKEEQETATYVPPPPQFGFPYTQWSAEPGHAYMRPPEDFDDFEKETSPSALYPLRGMFASCDCESQTKRPRKMDYYSYYNEYFYRLRACRSSNCVNCFHLLNQLDQDKPGSWKVPQDPAAAATAPVAEPPVPPPKELCGRMKAGADDAPVDLARCALLAEELNGFATEVTVTLAVEMQHAMARLRDTGEPLNRAQVNANLVVCKDMGCC